MSSISSCWSDSGCTLMPNAMSAVSPIGVVPADGLHSPRWLTTICEMKQGSACTRACTSPTDWLVVVAEPDDAELAPPKKSVRESAGQI